MNGFRPYVLWRRGALPAADLTALVPVRTWATLDEAERVRAERTALASTLVDDLHGRIPQLLVPDRRTLLAVRRALHNGRRLDPRAVAAAGALLPPKRRTDLDRITALHETEDRLLARGGAELTEELQAGRARLVETAGREEFLRGIQLSGGQLYRDVRAYLARSGAPGRRAKEHRRVECTITSFVARAVLRPSPFGAFTEVGAHAWRPAPTQPHRVHLTQIARGLLTWMAYELRVIDGADRVLMLRLNDTARVTDSAVELFARGPDGGPNAFGAEQFVSVPYVPAVRLVHELLTGGPRRQAEVTGRLVAAGITEAEATAFIDRLVIAGMFCRDLALPDQTCRYAEKVAVRLRTVGSDQAVACAEVFTELQVIEDTFGQADADRRAELLANVDTCVHRFVEVARLPPPPNNVTRTPIFEDVGNLGTLTSWDPDLLERNADNVALLQRLLPIFDDSTIEHLGLYRFVTNHFGIGTSIGLLDAYRPFAKLSPSAMSALMRGTDDPAAEQIRRIRDDVLRGLAKQLADAAGATTIQLDRRWVQELLAAAPAHLPTWTDSAFRIQFASAGKGPDQDRPLAVVSDVTIGHGVFFSRFCDLLDQPHPGQPDPERPHRWSLTEALRATLVRAHPGQADLTAVFGTNVNLHLSLAPLDVVYPGAVGRPDGAETLKLRDLVVRADPVARRLRLYAVDGRLVELVPMNFLFPAAGPLFYRFLCTFAPIRTYRHGLWERLWRTGITEITEATRFPRLLLDDLVLDRQSWLVPVADIPLPGDLDADLLDGLRVLDRWRRCLGQPRECFFRLVNTATRGGSGEPDDWLTQTHRWAVEARNARLRKPHCLDFHNPFLVRILARQVSRLSTGLVVFTEALPATTAYRDGGPRSAEEFLVEHAVPMPTG